LILKKNGFPPLSDRAITRPEWPPISPHSQNEEWANTFTHGLGFLLSLVGTVVLCLRAAVSQNSTVILGSAVYCGTLLLVYLASTLSHAIKDRVWRFRWRVLDQGVIYLLIAGSYMGFTLPLMAIEKNRYVMLMVWIWALMCCFHRTVIRSKSDQNGTISYLALGWIPICLLDGIGTLLPSESFYWLIAGGICYSLGVVFLVLDRRVAYFHAIWHLFVIIASMAHFLGIYKIVVTLVADDGS